MTDILHPSIHLARIEDLDAIVELAHQQEIELAQTDPHRVVPSKGVLRNLYSQRLTGNVGAVRYGVFVARVDTSAAGFSLARVPIDRPRPFYGLVQGVFINPQHRGKGIADRLTDQMTTFVEDAGASSIKGDVYPGGKGHRFFGERRGWTKEKTAINGLVRFSQKL